MRMGCFPGVVGFGTHDYPDDIHLVHLEVCEKPILVEARSFYTIGDFKTYWWEFRHQRDMPFLVAEQYSPDPNGVLSYLEERGDPLDRRHIEPFSSDYRADAARLGLDWPHHRACALALSLLYDFQAYCTTQSLLEGILTLSKELRALEQRASQLLLATGSRVDYKLLRIPF